MSSSQDAPDPAASKRVSQAPDSRPISVRHSTSAHRQSRLPAAPLPPLSVDARSLPAENAQITGTNPVSLAANAVVHPYSKLDSAMGPIVVGESVIIWEKAVVGIRRAESQEGETAAGKPSEDATSKRESGLQEGDSELEDAGVTLERYVVVGSGAVVEARTVGEGTVIGTAVKIGRGCVIGKHCRIAPNVRVPSFTELPDFTVVTGSTAAGLRMRVGVTGRDHERVRMLQAKGHDKQIELMRKLLKVNLAKWSVQI